MNEIFPRKVKLSTIVNIFLKNPIPSIFGFIFTLIPLALLIIAFVVSLMLNKSDDINYDLINDKGNEIIATITNIETEYNTSVNGIHPSIISYKYFQNGKDNESKYKVLYENIEANYSIDNQIVIKELNGISIIKGLKPYKFPFYILYLISIIFITTGLPLIIYSWIKANTEIRLFKYGKVSRGKIIEVTSISGLPITNIGQGLSITYEYESNGNNVIAKSFTTDTSVVNNKKNGELIPIFVSNIDNSKSCVVPKNESLKNDWAISFK